MDMNEKVAYIRGLMDGLKLNENDDTVKVVKSVVDLLEDIADEVTELGELYDELSEQVDEIDQDLSVVEDDLYDEDVDDDDEEDYDEFDEDEEYYEVICPTCGDEICVSEDILLEGSIDCPNCGEVLEFDFSDLCAEDINGDCSKCSTDDCALKDED